MPCTIANGRGQARTSVIFFGSFSIRRFWPLPCESATTISVAPAANAASIAVFTSWVINSRNRWYSKPCGDSCSPVTTPTTPSMSADINIFILFTCALPAAANTAVRKIAKQIPLNESLILFLFEFSFRRSSAAHGIENIKLAVGSYRCVQTVQPADISAVVKNIHVLTDLALFVEYAVAEGGTFSAQ